MIYLTYWLSAFASKLNIVIEIMPKIEIPIVIIANIDTRVSMSLFARISTILVMMYAPIMIESVGINRKTTLNYCV